MTFCWGFLNLIMEISEESHREMGAHQNSVAKSQHELGRGNFPWHFLCELGGRLTAKGQDQERFPGRGKGQHLTRKVRPHSRGLGKSPFFLSLISGFNYHGQE